MVREFTLSDVDKPDETMDFMAGGIARLAKWRDAARAKLSGAFPPVSGTLPAGRNIAGGRDLLRSPFPIGWSSRHL